MDPLEIPAIKEWVNENNRLSQYLKFAYFGDDKEKQKNFDEMREKYILRLKSLIEHVVALKQKCIQTLTELAQAPFKKIEALCFDEQDKNLCLRKYIFLHHKIQQTDLKLNNLIFDVFVEKFDDCNQFLLFLIQIMPDGVSCKIDDNFFLITLTKKIEKISLRLFSMKNYFKCLEEEIHSFVPPKWYRDFSGFMHDVLAKSVEHIDPELSYVPPLPFELQVSRYCFSTSNEAGEKIDELIQNIFDIPPVDFLQTVLDMSITLLPDPQSFTEDEQTVALLVFFRVIFDRLYELYPDFMFPSLGTDWIKMNELALLPCSAFTLPNDSSPAHTDDETIREAFRKDPYYRAASQFLENSEYSTNPIDSLYFIHKTLLSINKAALMNRMKEKEVSVNDLQQLLCFDDLFILFLGVYLSSDNYEFLSVADFVSRFSPAFCLSNSFEYAQASLESLVKHLAKMDPKKLAMKGAPQ